MKEGFADRLLVLAADHRYAPGLIVAAASALARLSTDARVDLLVFDEGLTALDKRIIAEVARRAPQTKLHVVSGFTALDHDAPTSGHITAATYSRLLIPSVAATAERALYLDADILVCADVAPLLSMDLGPAPVAASIDSGMPTIGEGLDYSLGTLRRPAEEPYYNAGVLVLDVARWRADGIADRILEYLDRWGDDVNWHDQDAINAVCGTTVSQLEARWNYQERVEAIKVGSRRLTLGPAEDGLTRAAVIHFNDAKPWLSLGWLFPNVVSRHAHARWWRFALTSRCLPSTFRALMLARFVWLPPFLVARKLWRLLGTSRG